MYSDKLVKYYDDLYNKKDYANESQFIESNSNITNLLDIGCGTGKHIESLYKKGRTVHGIDLSGDMIDIAKSKFNDDVLLTKCNVTSYKSDIKFDTIISMFNVVNHNENLNDLCSYFKSISNLLADSGVFIFDCFNGSSVFKDYPKDFTRTIYSNAYGGKYVSKCISKFNPMNSYLNMNNNVQVYHYDDLVDEFNYNIDATIWTPKLLKDLIEKYEIKVTKIVSNSDYDREATVDDYKITFVCVKYN